MLNNIETSIIEVTRDNNGKLNLRIECYPLELINSIEGMITKFSEISGIPYNEVLDDMKKVI